MKSKKAITMTVLTKLIIFAAIIILILTPFLTKIMGLIFGSLDSKYGKSFDLFVKNVNKQKIQTETHTLLLKEGSGIIGFSKGTVDYECRNCVNGGYTIPKPSSCGSGSCVCLCKTLSMEAKTKCEDELRCESLNKDLADAVPAASLLVIGIFSNTNEISYSVNGFLYANNKEFVMKDQKLQETSILTVEQVDGKVGVCSARALEILKQELKIDSCIATKQQLKLGSPA